MGELHQIRQPEESYVCIDEVAVYLRLSKAHVRKLADNGTLPFLSVGLGKRRFMRFKMSDVRQRLSESA
jgi:excisionase family DNA binding protein